MLQVGESCTQALQSHSRRRTEDGIGARPRGRPAGSRRPKRGTRAWSAGAMKGLQTSLLALPALLEPCQHHTKRSRRPLSGPSRASSRHHPSILPRPPPHATRAQPPLRLRLTVPQRLARRLTGGAARSHCTMARAHEPVGPGSEPGARTSLRRRARATRAGTSRRGDETSRREPRGT